MEATLKKIKANTLRANRTNIRKILMTIEVDGYPIGDSVVFFSKIRALVRYFNVQYLDILTNAQHHVFLNHSPLVRQFYFDISVPNLADYDLIINFSTLDKELAIFIDKHYSPAVTGRNINFGVYNLYRKRGMEHTLLFEYLYDFERYLVSEYLDERDYVGHELHLSEEERQWGNNWFRERGIKEGEKVIVLLDSSSTRGKLMPIAAYCEVLRFFRSFRNTRILIFDPDNIDKSMIYKHLLETEDMDDFLFVKRQGLRKDLCLLASDFIHIVLGPCTGLLHCAEGIYNTLDKKGALQREWPLLLAYIGPPESEDAPDKWFWWGETHVECLYQVADVTEPEKRQVKKLSKPGRHGLPCSKFMAAPFIKHLKEHYGQKFRTWGML